MRRTLLLLASLLPLAAAAQPAKPGADVAPFVDRNQRLVSRVDADLNGDGKPDTVIVTTGPKEFDTTVTVLLRAQGLQGIDALSLELSPLGPPTVSVKKGVLLVESLTGGSNVRVATTHRFRFDAEEGRMRLIGVDAERTSGAGAARVSWNALNGVRIVSQGGRESKGSYKAGTVYMSNSPSGEELLDRFTAPGSPGSR